MNISDVDEPKKHEELLAAAIPGNITASMDEKTIQALIKSASNAPMSHEDYSKHILIENLPSKYLRYAQGTKIYGRPLNIRELKKLANITPMNASTTIDDTLRGAIKGIAFDDILAGDKLYLILWLRANTYQESGYSVPFICPGCEGRATYDFKVENIEINYMRDDMNLEEPIEMPGGDFIVFKYPTIKDEMRIVNFKESVKKSLSTYDDDTLSLAIWINTVNGKSLSLMEVYSYISDVKLYSIVKGYVGEFEFGISEALTVKCNKCGGTAQVGLTFREDFIIPVYQSAKYSRNGIQNK